MGKKKSFSVVSDPAVRGPTCSRWQQMRWLERRPPSRRLGRLSSSPRTTLKAHRPALYTLVPLQRKHFCCSSPGFVIAPAWRLVLRCCCVSTRGGAGAGTRAHAGLRAPEWLDIENFKEVEARSSRRGAPDMTVQPAERAEQVCQLRLRRLPQSPGHILGVVYCDASR